VDTAEVVKRVPDRNSGPVILPALRERICKPRAATHQSAKFWLNPVTLALNLGFSPVELGVIQRMLEENKSMLLEKWNERFGS